MTDSTTWRLVGIPALPNRLRIDLVADTVSPAVVAAIEAAAREHGVILERVDGPSFDALDEPEGDAAA